MKKIGLRGARTKRLPSVRGEAVNLSMEEAVKTGFFSEENRLPLVMQPQLDAVDLPAWVQLKLGFIEEALSRYGGILFRGFDVYTQEEFERLVRLIVPVPMHYMEGATPRTQLSETVYTSTEFPASQQIAPHNELSYAPVWPGKILFFCQTPSDSGGETIITDVRKVYRRLSPEIIERFREKNWMLHRNYGNGLSLSWQQVFRTSSRAEFERYCRQAGIECEWVDANHLRTRQVRPALARHPRTGEVVWFNHLAFWHVTSLADEVRESMLTVFREIDLPYNTYYGDGSPVEPAVVEEIRAAYREETIAFPWRKGDVLLLDNMLVAHGRNPFSGPRRVLVSMGEPCGDRGF
jgi:alpha-ketoglutarate-dependent taurine dioxygenase